MHDSLHDAFVDGFVSRAAQIKLGDRVDPWRRLCDPHQGVSGGNLNHGRRSHCRQGTSLTPSADSAIMASRALLMLRGGICCVASLTRRTTCQ
ncbi:hypothetical protein [Paracoccus mutanolyticus]|uniref:hypothetical protein n=1 Tax=Paracoccus mutanolyticus TaxID=1499308 RepID=UPI000DD79772|nr:hypothetical protein [Paracoccus mutanolyticus]